MLILTLRIFKQKSCQGFSLLELLIVLFILSTFIGSINFFVLKPYKLEDIAVNVATQLKSAQNISKYQNKIVSFNLNSERLTFFIFDMLSGSWDQKITNEFELRNIEFNNQVKKANVYVSEIKQPDEKIIINNNPINENILIELVGEKVCRIFSDSINDIVIDCQNEKNNISNYGFSLLEVLVALFICTISIWAAIKGINNLTRNFSDIESAIYASWSAENLLIERRIKKVRFSK